MIAVLNLVFAFVLLLLAFLWYREGHIANLSLAAQGTRIALVAFAALGTVTVANVAALELIGFVPRYHDALPTIAVAIRAFIGIILLALVLTTARSRRTGRWS